jgi:succinyl-CoA synthetase alpha subunit
LNTKDSIDYGTRVVGGMSPGKAGKYPTLGLLVYNTVKEVISFAGYSDYKAKKDLDPHASAVFVPATLAAKVIEEAIEGEIPLIVSVAEGMPVHDCLRVFILQGTIHLDSANPPHSICITAYRS